MRNIENTLKYLCFVRRYLRNIRRKALLLVSTVMTLIIRPFEAAHCKQLKEVGKSVRCQRKRAQKLAFFLLFALTCFAGVSLFNGNLYQTEDEIIFFPFLLHQHLCHLQTQLIMIL